MSNNGSALSLLEAIQRATPADLEAVEKRMEQLNQELGALTILHKALSLKVNGVPATAGRVSGRKRLTKDESEDARKRLTKDESEDARKRLAQYLAKNGATSAAALAERLTIPPTKVFNLLNHPWFTRSAQGYHITPEGRQAAC